MSDPRFKIDVATWVENAKDNPVLYQQRQTIEITLSAIARTTPLSTRMFLKGGTLMGLVHNSPRQTSDLDLTAAAELQVNNLEDEIAGLLDPEFQRATATLGYADLVVKTQKVTRKPKGDDKSFPALELNVASARRGTRQERELWKGTASLVVKVEISFNEPLPQIQMLELAGGQELGAYSLVDLIAEKYRALLQQPQRNRYRRQDVYDLDWLIKRNEFGESCRTQILETLVHKCHARNLNPTLRSLSDPEIKRRAESYWDSMEFEWGKLPDFEGCFARVCEFYRNLPWDSKPIQLAELEVSTVPYNLSHLS